MQLSLFGTGQPQPDGSFSRLIRRSLGEGAWLDFSPGWLQGDAVLMDQLVRAAAWEVHRRNMYDRIVEVPRLVANLPGSSDPFPFGTDSTEQVSGGQPPDVAQIAAVRPVLRKMSSVLSHRYGRRLDQITLAYYRDGRDSVAFHGDKLGVLRKDTVVAICSVGAKRNFLLRRSSRSGESSLCYSFGEGDLLVMGGNCQETWEHAVPKMRSSGPRVAIMFRERVPELAPVKKVAFSQTAARRAHFPGLSSGGSRQPIRR